MLRNHSWAAPLIVAVLALAPAGCDAEDEQAVTWSWDDVGLPPGFPTPRVPGDNPMSPDKVELGRFLFYDVRLSGNLTQSCASCHLQSNAFAEPRATSIGSTGESHPKNAMSLTNVAYNATQTWANPLLVHLEQQALIPMFGEEPVELGLAGLEGELVARIAADERYPDLFSRAFPEERGRIGVDTIVKAIAAFQRTLISADSAYDRFWYRKDPSALSADAIAGFDLFFSERLECFHCHGDFNFQGSSAHSNTTFDEVVFHNNGLYNINNDGSYPPGNEGLFDITGKPADRGRFKAPTLRNIIYTAPYMHDGSLGTLDEVIDMYMAGGRVITNGPNAGDGRNHPQKSEFVRGFTLTDAERRHLKAFLESLGDATFVTNPRLSDPFVVPGD